MNFLISVKWITLPEGGRRALPTMNPYSGGVVKILDSYWGINIYYQYDVLTPTKRTIKYYHMNFIVQEAPSDKLAEKFNIYEGPKIVAIADLIGTIIVPEKTNIN